MRLEINTGTKFRLESEKDQLEDYELASPSKDEEVLKTHDRDEEQLTVTQLYD